MVESFNKFVLKMFDGKEYSPGLIIKFTNIEVEKKKNLHKILYKIKLINEGDVPFETFVVLHNLNEEIEKLLDYFSFDRLRQNIEIILELDEDQYENIEFIYMSKYFKKSIFEKISNINQIDTHIPNYEQVQGKFLHRINSKSSVGGGGDIIFHFKTEELPDYLKKLIEENLEDYLDFDLEVGDKLKNAIKETMEEWGRNFYLDSGEPWFDNIYDYMKIKVNII